MNILEIKDIKYFADNTDIIKGISFDIKKGDCISVVGASGSGKSTMLKILSDLISPTSGNITYKNKDYKEYDPISLRQSISYCVQIPYLFGDTVYDNLAYPFEIRNKEVDEKKILDYMKKFNLNNSNLHKGINSLSGGEKQRVALIRNLIFEPEVLLLDEVTASLDKENAQVVEGIIKDMNDKGTTVIWVTHSEKQSESIFNKRITIDEGKVLESEVLA